MQDVGFLLSLKERGPALYIRLLLVIFFVVVALIFEILISSLLPSPPYFPFCKTGNFFRC